MNNYLNDNGTFNHGAWQRDQTLNEGPYNDPALKALRLRTPGEDFPEVSKWWEYEPEDIIRYVYWHQGQLPPTGPKMEKEWANLVKQLHIKYPIPADAEGHLDMDTIGEARPMASGPYVGKGRPFQPGDMWSEDFDYVGMLQWGVDANTETMDLETLKAGFESFTDVNYHREAQDLGNALDWLEDNPATDQEHNKIESFMSSFNSASAKTLKDITRR